MAAAGGEPIEAAQGRSLDLRLGVAAVLILVFSFSALAYSILAMEGTSDVITVNGVEYEWDMLGKNFTVVEVDGRTGVRLSDIINDTGLEDPASRNYAIIGADGYRKTVEWSDMLNGILVIDSKEVYFTSLEKQYYVHDVVEIEVV